MDFMELIEKCIDFLEKNELARVLEQWARIFIETFDLQIPMPIIRIVEIDENTLGQVRFFFLFYEIIINSRHIGRPFWRICGTFFHEVLHIFQREHGTPGKCNAHNAEFRAIAAGYGLVINERGYTRYTEGTFTRLLRKAGAEIPELRGEDSQLHLGVGANHEFCEKKWLKSTERGQFTMGS
ncbi:MAG: hypothetical protein ABIH66_10930 [bacterium]